MEDTLIEISQEEEDNDCINKYFTPCIFSIMTLILIAAIIIFIYGVRSDD